MSKDQYVISFGKGVRLMSEAYYIQEMGAFGINTNRAFRSLCRAICCPLLFIGRVGFVDPAVFQICIKNLSIPGSKDFLFPNCYLKTYVGRPHLRQKVDPKDIESNWKYVVRAIIDSRKMHGLHVPGADKIAIKTAAAELTRFTLRMIPSAEQETTHATTT